MNKLDAIIAVGYRVNSIRATQFRQWASRQGNACLSKNFFIILRPKADQRDMTEQLLSEATFYTARSPAGGARGERMRHLFRFYASLIFLYVAFMVGDEPNSANALLKGET